MSTVMMFEVRLCCRRSEAGRRKTDNYLHPPSKLRFVEKRVKRSSEGMPRALETCPGSVSLGVPVGLAGLKEGGWRGAVGVLVIG